MVQHISTAVKTRRRISWSFRDVNVCRLAERRGKWLDAPPTSGSAACCCRQQLLSFVLRARCTQPQVWRKPWGAGSRRRRQALRAARSCSEDAEHLLPVVPGGGEGASRREQDRRAGLVHTRGHDRVHPGDAGVRLALYLHWDMRGGVSTTMGATALHTPDASKWRGGGRTGYRLTQKCIRCSTRSERTAPLLSGPQLVVAINACMVCWIG